MEALAGVEQFKIVYLYWLSRIWQHSKELRRITVTDIPVASPSGKFFRKPAASSSGAWKSADVYLPLSDEAIFSMNCSVNNCYPAASHDGGPSGG